MVRESSDSINCPLCLSHETTWFFHDDQHFQQTYYHCQHCDFVFVIPQCRLNSIDEKARYDHHENDGVDYRQFLARLANPLLKQLHQPAKGLDFGSGRSQMMANLFRQAGHSCDCYDIYYYPDKMLLKKSYDFLIASEVIEHLYQPKTTFETWLQLLNSGGLLAIMTGIRPCDGEFSTWWYKNDPTHVGLYSQKTLDYLSNYYQLTVVARDNNVIIFSTPEID